MRIMHINSADHWAGGEVYTNLVCRELVQYGFDVVLACRPHSAIQAVFQEQAIPTLPLPLKGAGDLGSARRLADYCRRNDVGILHAHLGRDYWLAAEAKYFYPDMKLVFTRHVLIPAKNTLFHRWMFKQADKVIAVSDAVREVFLHSAGVADDKVITVHNGVDVGRFRQAESGRLRAELRLGADVPLVGIVGQVSSHKGQDIFIRSIPGITKKVPDSRFVIIGDDFRQGEYIKQLKELAGDLGVADRVVFLGPRTDLPQLLKDFQVFVLASHREPFGFVVVEAMAAGVPVVATACGGVTEIIRDGQDGLLIPPGDAETMAGAVVTILNTPAMAAGFIASAQERVEARFSLQAMMEGIVAVYGQVGVSSPE